MEERTNILPDRVRAGEMLLQGVHESQKGEVRKAATANDGKWSDMVLDRMQRGESYEGNADEESSIECTGSAPKRFKTGTVESLQTLDNIWNKAAVDSKKGRLDVVQDTQKLLAASFTTLIQDGKKAHHEWARVQQELDLSNEYIASKTHEIERLRALDTKNRENISVRIRYAATWFALGSYRVLSRHLTYFQKLLRTVTSSNETTKEQSQAKVSEARLRSDLLQMTKSRDEATEQLDRAGERCKVLENDLVGVKSQLAKEQQAKKQMERDQQAAKSLANAFRSGNHSDVDFYKRKVCSVIAYTRC